MLHITKKKHRERQRGFCFDALKLSSRCWALEGKNKVVKPDVILLGAAACLRNLVLLDELFAQLR